MAARVFDGTSGRPSPTGFECGLHVFLGEEWGVRGHAARREQAPALRIARAYRHSKNHLLQRRAGVDAPYGAVRGLWVFAEAFIFFAQKLRSATNEY